VVTNGLLLSLPLPSLGNHLVGDTSFPN
jgi:hypothetical protein